MTYITSVESAYGHAFLTENDHEKCLNCGAEYDLVLVSDEILSNHGRYQSSSGEDPTLCRDMPDGVVHGYDSISLSHHSLDGCKAFDDHGRCVHTDHNCNCNLCGG